MELTLRFVHRPRRGPRIEADIQLSSSAIGLSGPSGIGKTTLLRIIAGVERGAEGQLTFDKEVWQDTAKGLFRPPQSRRIGWVPQESLLFPHLSVRENLLFGHRPERNGPALDEVVGPLELAPLLSRQPRHLSGGERQKAAIARALLSAPGLLLLDEPLAALDRPSRARVSAALHRLCAHYRIQAFLVTHDEQDLRDLADVTLTLNGGRLVLAADDSTDG